MLSSGLIEFLFYLLIPVVLVSFFQGRQSNDTSLARKKRLCQSDYIVYISLVSLAALYFIHAIFQPPPNVFKRIDASPHLPCQPLRAQLREYGRTHPSTLPATGVPTVAMKNDRSFALLDYYMGSEYGRLDFLVDRFCTYEEDRNVYLKFGESAFMNSIASSFGPRGMAPRIAMPNKGERGDFISEFPDIGFLLFAVSGQVFAYLPAFLAVGFVTTPFFASEFAPSRVYVRPWGVITLCILFFADVFWLFTVPTVTRVRAAGTATLWLVSPDHTDAAVFFADSTAFTRSVFIAISLLAFLAMDYITSSRQTDIQLLQKCIRAQSDALTYSKDHTVLETAVLLSDRLRERMVAMWKRERGARDQVFADEEFKQTYERVAVETKSKQWVDQNAPAALKRFGFEDKD